MGERTLGLYGDKIYGVKVSDYGLENGYLDYQTLVIIVGDMILNNTVRAETMTDREIVAGEFKEMIFQDYIITEQGYEFLRNYTDEIVFYNEKLDLYIWGITHFGTAWSHVLTDIKIIK